MSTPASPTPAPTVAFDALHQQALAQYQQARERYQQAQRAHQQTAEQLELAERALVAQQGALNFVQQQFALAQQAAQDGEGGSNA